MSALDLRKLEHVLALADTLHFGRACLQVHLSQSALSRSIQSLENVLGAQLFVRKPRSVELTPYGCVVVERARRILFEATQMSNELRLMRDGGFGTVAVGLGATPAALLAPKILQGVGQMPAGARTSIKRASTEQLIQMLYCDEVDIVCADVAPLDALEDRARLLVEDLPQWPVALCCRAGHPLLAQGGRVLRADLIQYPFASTRLSAFALAWIQRELCIPDGFARRMVMESDSFDDLIAATEASDAILVASLPVLSTVGMSHSVQVIPLNEPLTNEPRFGIVRLAGGELPPVADVVMNVIRQIFREHAECVVDRI